MPFVRIHGNKILILHSRRRGRRVEQIRLQEWSSAAEARAIVEDENHWNRLCGSIRATLGPKARWKPEQLRSKLVETLTSAPEILEEPSRVATLSRQLSACLTDFEAPLSPRQKRLLGQAEKALLRLISQIPDALATLHRKGLDSDWMEDYMETGTAEHLFDRGIDAWEAGRWDEARMKWHAGLELDPDHVDLHVHAGLSEEMEENWSLALLHYEKAIDLGRPFVDGLIEKDPEFYVTSEAKKRLVETLTSCDAPDEHPPPHDRPCEECIENLDGRIGSFRGHLEVRPFLRALYNRALLLKRLGRHQEAIETLEVRCRYQDDPNSRTLQAECHLLLGNLDRAEQLYWALGAGSAYVYSLILLKRGKREGAMDWLLKAVFWNPYMGELLLGRREPEPVRWKGSILPRDKDASEFWYEYEHYFKSESLWRSWLRLVLDDDRIREVRETLEEAIQSRETDRQYRMDPLNWGLHTGHPDIRFLEEHRERLLQRARRPRKPRVSGTRSWMPEVGSVITGTLQEEMGLDWRLDVRGATIHFRVGETSLRPELGEPVRIQVAKCWRYRRLVFVSGELLESVAQTSRDNPPSLR